MKCCSYIIVVVNLIYVAFTFAIFFIEFSDEAAIHCLHKEWKMFNNCSIDYLDKSMWCDNSILTRIPHPRRSNIKTQLDPMYINKMYLNNSCVDNLTSGILSQYRYLWKLNVDNNYISSLRRNTFKRCPSLMEIVLSRNKLATINNDAFAGLTKLDTLILSKNLLTKITEDVFSNLYKLRILDLSDNLIDHLREQAFVNLQELQELNMAGNQLNEISKYDFSNLPNLKTLNLRQNHITKIHQYAFYGSQLLQSIDLGYNNVTCLSKEIFSDNANLVSIQLNNNDLRLPRSEWFQEVHNPRERPTQHSVSLVGNQWSCNCETYAYLKFLQDLNDEEWEETFHIRCSSPEKLKGKTVLSLPSSTYQNCKMSIEDTGSICPGETISDPPRKVFKSTTTTTTTTTTRKEITTVKSTTLKAIRMKQTTPHTIKAKVAMTVSYLMGDKNFISSHFNTFLFLLMMLFLLIVIFIFSLLLWKKKQRSCDKQRRANQETKKLNGNNRSSDEIVSYRPSNPQPPPQSLSQRYSSNMSEDSLLLSVSERLNDLEVTEPKTLLKETWRRSRNDSGCYSIPEEHDMFRRSLQPIPENYHVMIHQSWYDPGIDHGVYLVPPSVYRNPGNLNPCLSEPNTLYESYLNRSDIEMY